MSRPITKDNITLAALSGLAEQLAADLTKVREILAQATAGDITPAQAADALRETGIAIL